MNEIRSQVERANGEATGGLLIGGPEDGGYWIERVLACRNTAANPATSYRIDPAILANVGRSLEASGHAILGVFFGGASARRAESVRANGLVWRIDLEGRMEDGLVGAFLSRVPVEVLAEPPSRALICPE